LETNKELSLCSTYVFNTYLPFFHFSVNMLSKKNIMKVDTKIYVFCITLLNEKAIPCIVRTLLITFYNFSNLVPSLNILNFED